MNATDRLNCSQDASSDLARIVDRVDLAGRPVVRVVPIGKTELHVTLGDGAMLLVTVRDTVSLPAGV